jgi:predicted enzyme related to lactoylglutathione lyase
MPDTPPPPHPAEHDLRADYLEFGAASAEHVAACRRFYEQAFGWAFTDYGPEYASFVDGRLAGGFTTGRAPTRGGALVVLFALDLADAERRVRGAGGEVVAPAYEFPGGRRFHFTDPAGNELAVWSDR